MRTDWGIKPHEMVLVIDLRAKKKTILEQCKQLVGVWQGIKADLKSGAFSGDEAYFNELIVGEGEWLPDNSRYRKEGWGHLEVWKLRRQKKTFKEIAETLSINEQTAKDRFYRAFELIQGRPYDPAYDKRELWSYRIEDIGKTCDDCEQRENCSSLCPDMILFAEQDQQTYTKELLVDEADRFADREE